MRIAIATYGEMISPRFDCASTLHVLEWVDNPAERREERLLLDDSCCHATLLLHQNVTALLCGGIRRCDYHRLTDAGMEVVAGNSGPYLDIFREYVAGRLKSLPSWERPQGCGRGMGRGQGSGIGQGRGMGRGRGQSGRGGAGQGPRGNGSGPRRR